MVDKEYFKEWRKNNRAKLNQYRKNWRDKNPDKWKAYRKRTRDRWYAKKKLEDPEYIIKMWERINKKYGYRNTGTRQRFRIFNRDNFTCQYCGRKAPDVVLEVDHKTAFSKGGKTIDDNLITACLECNRGKYNS